MRIISWNLNGLPATLESGCLKAVEKLRPDVLCLQEIRTEREPNVIKNYRHIWNHAVQSNYSGTVTITRYKPIFIDKGFDYSEGRIITTEFEKIFVVNVYVPNSQLNLKRHEYRLQWDEKFFDYICELKDEKPIVICGDFNVTRSALDVFESHDKMQAKELGFLSDERNNLELLLSEGFVDVFRELNPTTRSYTWWSNRLNQRDINHGWRLDYFIVSENLMEKISAVEHLTEILGSDHCPIMLELAL